MPGTARVETSHLYLLVAPPPYLPTSSLPSWARGERKLTPLAHGRTSPRPLPARVDFSYRIEISIPANTQININRGLIYRIFPGCGWCPLLASSDDTNL